MIKKNILVISYGFDFENSTNATAHCLQSLLPYLRENLNVTIFTNGICDKITKRDCVEVHKFAISSNLDAKLRLSLFSKRCLLEASELILKKEIYSILTISFPFRVSEIGCLIKKQFPDLKLVSYFLDPYAYNSALRFNKMLFIVRYIKELIVINSSDYIIIANILECFYQKGLFSFKKNKIVSLPIPILNLKQEEKENNIGVNKSIKLVFAGALDSDYRNPNGFLKKMLDIFRTYKNFNIDIYTSNKEIIDNNLVKEFKGNLKVFDFIDKRELQQKLTKADILVNIGNKGLKASLPSKLIEYVGYKKPILNYYFEDNDLSMRFLQRYSSSFSVKDSDTSEECLDNLSKFIKNATNYEITDDEIINSYPEYLISNISDKIITLLTD